MKLKHVLSSLTVFLAGVLPLHQASAQVAPVSFPMGAVEWRASNVFVAAGNAIGIMHGLVKPGATMQRLGEFKTTALSYQFDIIGASSANGPVTAFGDAGPFPTQLNLGGGAVWQTEEDGLTTEGGVLTLTNWTIDAMDFVVKADVVTSRGLNLMQAAVFSLGQPVEISFAEGSNLGSLGKTVFSNMRFTALGEQVFTEGLALRPEGVRVVEILRSSGLGTLTLPVSIVPETGTWALMLLGFAGMGAIAARKDRQI